MPTLNTEQLALNWQQLLALLSPEQHQQLSEVVQQHKAELAEYFYIQMMQDEAIAEYLSHDLVRSKLNQSMQLWISELFCYSSLEHLQALVIKQTKAGQVHARIGIPVHLVLRGTRHLKQRFTEILPTELQPCLEIFYAIIDLAIEIMSQAYSHSDEYNSKAEEAYRLFAVSQNIAYEQDKQRAALLNWENRLMFDCAVGQPAHHLERLKSSEFGLWFLHKGAHAFSGTPESIHILKNIAYIDEVLLPSFDVSSEQKSPHYIKCLRNLRECSKAILFHLDHLFEQNSELESGRDVLTRLLNRKFLQAVLSKETQYARQHNSMFALFVIDIDHFKHINDTFGHESGDLALQHLSTLLANHSRGGDYLFRMGGEEFLMVRVDSNPHDAKVSANKICREVEKETLQLPGGQQIKLTISIGIALHDGYPDYQRTLRRADEALYQAKHLGRNGIFVAT